MKKSLKPTSEILSLSGSRSEPISVAGLAYSHELKNGHIVLRELHTNNLSLWHIARGGENYVVEFQGQNYSCVGEI